jgi:hypothetical protein
VNYFLNGEVLDTILTHGPVQSCVNAMPHAGFMLVVPRPHRPNSLPNVPFAVHCVSN